MKGRSGKARGSGVAVCGVLPTRNRGELLGCCLESLGRQSLRRERWEVVVVDDGSTDDTAGVVASFGRDISVRYRYQAHWGIGAAKNRAVELARGEIVVFLDDDDVCSPTLFEEHLAAHETHPEPWVAVLGRTELAADVARSPVMRFVTEVGNTLFSYGGLQDGEWLDYQYFWGGRSSCKRSFLIDHGLFDEGFQFGCEDIELGYRLSKVGLRVLYDAQAVSVMARSLSFDEFCERTRRQGRANFRFGQIHPVEEVLRWGDVVDAAARWKGVAPALDDLLREAREADRLANQKVEAGKELDRPFLRRLHGLYQRSFDACRLMGIMEAAREWGGAGAADQRTGAEA